MHSCENVLPLMWPLHTHGHALPLVNFRLLSVDASSSSQFCAASPVQAVSQQPAQRVPHPAGSPRAAIQRTLFLVLECGSTPSARQLVPPLFVHVHPWRSPTAQLSAPPAVALMHTALVSRVSCTPSRPTSRARWAFLAAPCHSPPILS